MSSDCRTESQSDLVLSTGYSIFFSVGIEPSLAQTSPLSKLTPYQDASIFEFPLEV